MRVRRSMPLVKWLSASGQSTSHQPLPCPSREANPNPRWYSGKSVYCTRMKWKSASRGGITGSSSPPKGDRKRPLWASAAIVRTATAPRISELRHRTLPMMPGSALQAVNHFHDHGTDDIEALRAQLIHGVGVLVPRRIIDVDDVDGRHAQLDERHVIVFFPLLIVLKICAVAQLSGRGPHHFSQGRVALRLLFDVQVLIADHVDVDQRLQPRERAVFAPAVGQVPAAVQVVGIDPLLADGFFAVEKH